MSAPTPAPTDFEDQVAAALRRRAAPITAEAGARDAIDHRIAQRTRARRARRAGLAAVVAIVLLAGALALAQRGHDDARVVTVPDPSGTPAADLPQLGLPADLGRTRVYTYSPGRAVGIVVTPKGADQNPVLPGPPGIAVGSATIRVTVTDLSPAQVIGLNGPQDAVTLGSMNNLPILSRRIDPLFGGSVLGEAVWSPGPGVVAGLDVALAPDVADAGAKAVDLAGRLVELDDRAWLSLLDGDPTTRWLGLSGQAGGGEIAELDPVGGSRGPRGLLRQVLDVPGRPPGTYRLTGGPLGGEDPALSETSDVLDHVAVRGTTGQVSSYPRYAATTIPYVESLVWVEDGTRYTLDFTSNSTDVGAAEVADRLGVLSPDQWHEMLFPAILRTDLVPMTDLAASATTTTGG